MKTKIFYSGVLVILLAAITFISCSKSSYNSGNMAPATASVSIKNMAFNPGSLSVTAGTMVTWNNSDTTLHAVIADDGSFNSGNIAIGAVYTRVFNSAGTFTYHDGLHPETTGKIVVTAAVVGMY